MVEIQAGATERLPGQRFPSPMRDFEFGHSAGSTGASLRLYRFVQIASGGKTGTCPEGTLDISRWCKPPERHEH